MTHPSDGLVGQSDPTAIGISDNPQSSKALSSDASASPAPDQAGDRQPVIMEQSESQRDDSWEQRYERDHRCWYASHGPTITGYLNSARRSARSLLTRAGAGFTGGGLVGKVADWTLGPARPDVDQLLKDLGTANEIEERRGRGTKASLHAGLYDWDLQSRVSALSAWPDAAKEFLTKSRQSHIEALDFLRWIGPGSQAGDRALRHAAATQLSEILGQSAESSSLLSYEERVANVAAQLASIRSAASTDEESGSRAAMAMKLNSLLPEYAPLTDERKKALEWTAWHDDLCGYLSRGVAF